MEGDPHPPPKVIGDGPPAPPSAAQPRSHRGLARATLGGVGWLLAQNLGARFVGFGSQIVLARILAPSDFASLALAGTVTAVVGILANFGVDDVLMQRQRTLHVWTRPAFIISLALGIAGMLIVVAATPLAARIYRAPILYTILPIMALSMPLGALSTVPNAKLRADLRYRFLATYGTIDMVVGQVSTICLALAGFGVLSFVLPGPVLAAARSAILWALAKPHLSRMRRRQLVMMSTNSAVVFGTKIITTLVAQGDYFTLGLLAAKPIVGAYFFAFRLAVQPVQMLAGNLSSVMFPALAQLRNDPARQLEAALNASRVLAFAVMPYCFLQAAVAPPLLTLVFGAKWHAAIPLVQILSIGLAFDAVSWIAGALLNARGEFRRSLVYSCVFSPIFFVLVAIGALLYSAVGVATAVSAFYTVLAPVYSSFVFGRAGVSLRKVADIYLASTAFAALAMIVAASVSRVAPFGLLGQTAVTTVLGICLYLGLIRVFAPSSYLQVVGRLRDVARSKV